MSKKYILNKTNSVLLLQDAKVNTIVKLNPKKCSFQSFDEDYLFSSPYVQRMMNKGYIELLDDIISKVFNPDTLLLHIDEVRNFIAPYVKKDRESGAGKIKYV